MNVGRKRRFRPIIFYRMLSRQKFYFFFVPLLVFFFSVVMVCAAEKPVNLVLMDTDNRILFEKRMTQPAVFAIRYTHSVALSPVTDYFIIKNNRIFLDKTVYKDFGAGLPPAPEGGQTMKFGMGKIVISGYNREFSSFDLRVGRIANHTLLLWGNASPDQPCEMEIPLNGIAAPGTAVTFALEPPASE